MGRGVAVIGAALLVTMVLPGASVSAAGETVDVRLIAFNDLHGNLDPPTGSSGRVTLPDGSTVDAGGAAYLATHVDRLRAEARNSVVLSAGDNIGASPVKSALFHDEPTIGLLNEIGVRASVVGNHEFDEGYAELRRIQSGGCHPADGCQFREPYDGADFPYLGANVTFDDGRPALLPFRLERVGGTPIGIIGVTLEDLPAMVTPEAVEGLEFGDEVEAIDRTADVLDRFGVKAQVVLLHQGDGTEGGGPDDCRVKPGPASEIAAHASPKVDVVFTGHSHQQYNCVVNDPAGNPRTVLQGASFGRLLSVADLTIDRQSRDVVRARTRARNEVVTRDVPPDPDAQRLIDEAAAKAGPIANRPVGTIAADLVRQAAPSGESPLGDVIADAQLEATAAGGAQVAITNPGGIRTDLVHASSPAGEGDGVVTYGEAYAVQPFGNVMQTMTLTGAQLKAVLEQQWQPGATRVLQVSATLRYTYSASAPVGSKVSGITVAGQPVDPNAPYRVAVNNFLAGGGDGFTEFTRGTDITGGPVDLDALIGYLGAHPAVAPPPADRITATP
ncbi:5'-nucleotidase-like protein [Saccharopolyspora erythraea NRRL 2338]|uniref:5'-nucleotidase-like protein n=3 Tax=Saccharopolyspora erythraea TaxID=1836 RepID=A4FIW3_SACEN|nr:metallophosphatase [Saccharopolyspora erythraea D]QRK93753.1 5'-nucleotidase C-terminal domain-containing protein [Saccharopolyspora erythraea]CAM03988.1 5'-nucleotidase-like protein [Saccharopolyspora erythraea NRRL 2338]